MAERTEYETRTTRITHTTQGDEIYSEMAINVEIVSQGAGEYISISSPRSDASIEINPEEWPTLQEAIGRMVSACR